jgi:hypothetical protein
MDWHRDCRMLTQRSKAMYRYQVRLPENMTLEDLVADMTVKAWMMVNRNFDFSRHPYQFYAELQNCIISQLMQHVKTYDLCGAAAVCTNAIENKPLAWNAEQHVQAEDCICHLILQTDLEEFIEELALKATNSIKDILLPHCEIKAFHTLQMVFRFVLADYIYFNPQCGIAKICESSEEITAWGRVAHKMIN